MSRDDDIGMCDLCATEEGPRRSIWWGGAPAWCCIDCIVIHLGAAQSELEVARRELGLLRAEHTP